MPSDSLCLSRSRLGSVPDVGGFLIPPARNNGRFRIHSGTELRGLEVLERREGPPACATPVPHVQSPLGPPIRGLSSMLIARPRLGGCEWPPPLIRMDRDLRSTVR